ncbi:1-acyl-sn-glycerol-3-phosphate acyltransferase alpha [Anthonomus grandis grandis]|uniref:1-acyl-sn-glycerol-3-phosphate acyltransferase alpha n=1 Tax=Anthonomus grandis grandis TaxID=2921223 RepID=UPI00216564BB|nr:1-acyl-sn-glycerol-3-phosphate acyltransferase alpha [Anthonomus grandis grandis]
MSIYLEVLMFGALLGLPFLYETRPTFSYCLKFVCYYTVVMINSVILIPPFSFRPRNVLNLVVASYFCHWITHVIGVKWILRDGKHLEADQSCVIVCNHQSSLDILGMFQIWPTMRKCTVLAKKSLFWIWPFGLAAWLAGIVFIPRVKTDRARVVLNQAMGKLVKNKIKLWIFPEGTRRNTGEIHTFKKGAFHAAISNQLPVIPVVFSRYYFLDRANKKFDQGSVIIKVLAPMSTKGLTLDDVDSFTEEVCQKMAEAFREVNREVSKEMESNCDLKRVAQLKQ